MSENNSKEPIHKNRYRFLLQLILCITCLADWITAHCDTIHGQHQLTLSSDNGRYTLCTGAMLGAEYSINTTLCLPCNSQTQEVLLIFSSYKCGNWHIQRLTNLQSNRAHAPSQDSLWTGLYFKSLTLLPLKGFPCRRLGDSSQPALWAPFEEKGSWRLLQSAELAGRADSPFATSRPQSPPPHSQSKRGLFLLWISLLLYLFLKKLILVSLRHICFWVDLIWLEFELLKKKIHVQFTSILYMRHFLK